MEPTPPPITLPKELSHKQLHARWATAIDVPHMIALAESCNLHRLPNKPAEDFARMVQCHDSGIATAWASGALAAMVSVGYDGRRGYLSYGACLPEHRGTGLMPALFSAAEDWLTQRGTPRTLLFVRKTESQLLRYYEARGYEVDDSVHLLVKSNQIDQIS